MLIRLFVLLRKRLNGHVRLTSFLMGRQSIGGWELTVP